MSKKSLPDNYDYANISEYIPANVPDAPRMSPTTLDDYYINAYLDNPENKTAAYKVACEQIGKTYDNKYAPQYARSLHKRLESQISKQLDELEIEDAALARSKLRHVLKNSENEAAIIAAAKELARKRVQKISVEQVETPDDIQEQIEAVQKRILAAQNLPTDNDKAH